MNEILATPPIADGLFAVIDGGLTLHGARCADCGTVAFPTQASCPRCTGLTMDEHALATDGTLWTWTTQGFRPKSPPYTGPEEFEEYAVGYVELGGEIRVEGRIVDAELPLRIGMPMRLVPLVLETADGSSRLTFAFAPTGEEAAA